MNLFELYNKFRQNPMSMLQQRYNIPSEIQNPEEIVKHLVSTGQITQNQVNQAMNMSRMFQK